MFRTVRRFVSALVLISASLPFGFSQTSTANLTGLISDPAGIAIPAVKVKLENVATHEKREAMSSNEGRVTFSQVLPGVYDLQAEATGFKSFTQRNVTLVSGQSGAANISMQIGELSQRVEVCATPVQVDTQTANQAVTLEREMVLALPTNLRNPFTLVHATAGVTAPATGISQSADQNRTVGFNYGAITTVLPSQRDARPITTRRLISAIIQKRRYR
jgi:hypothetical protein